MSMFQPASLENLRDVVAGAAASGEALEICGAGSKRDLGRPLAVPRRLGLNRLSGIVSYEPAELVLTARAGTSLAEIETLLGANRQMLAFEPPDWRGLLASSTEPTLGGALACNLAGSRRIKAGAARDHFLGFIGVNGFGEIFKAGGKVVKNVTGYDLCKLMAGSYGTLAVLGEVTIKTVPRPDESCSLLVLGLDDPAAIAAMTEALNAPHEVSAAAHLPAAIAKNSSASSAGRSITALRLEGPATSIAFRAEALRELLGRFGQIEILEQIGSERLWREIGKVVPLLPRENRLIWRLSLPPAAGAEVMVAVRRQIDVAGFYDWGGGLLWLAVEARDDGAANIIRAALATCGGHATLVRAPDVIRAAVPVFQPLSPALAALTRRVKDSFDPRHILNPGRLYPDI